MARNKRNITIKVIENKKENDKMLIEFFAKKYSEKHTNQKS